MNFFRYGKWLAWIGLAVGIGGGVWLWHGSHTGKAEEPPAPAPVALKVTTATVIPRAVRRTVDVVGTLEGHEEVNIAAKVEGRISHIYKDVGDEVAPGDLLLEIDDTDYKLAVLEAQRGLELELARLGLRELLADGKLDLARLPAIVRARNLEENANLVMERSRRLGMGRVVSPEELEKAQTEARVALAAREQAEMEARATLAAARHRQAQLETARQRLTDTRVLVPRPSTVRLPPGVTDPASVRYVISSRKVSEGEMVRNGPNQSALFRLVIDRPLKLVAQVPERYTSDIRLNQLVEVRVEAYPGKIFTGRVSRINPTVERVNRTFLVEVTIPNEDRQLRPGSFTKASIIVHEAEKVLTVPEEAVVQFAGVVKLFLIRDGKARSVPVQTGERLAVVKGTRRERWIEVRGDIEEGNLVITSDQVQLADDVAVSLREASSR